MHVEYDGPYRLCVWCDLRGLAEKRLVIVFYPEITSQFFGTNSTLASVTLDELRQYFAYACECSDYNHHTSFTQGHRIYVN